MTTMANVAMMTKTAKMTRMAKMTMMTKMIIMTKAVKMTGMVEMATRQRADTAHPGHQQISVLWQLKHLEYCNVLA